MPGRSPDQITRWLAASLHRFDGPQSYLGTEPNAARRSWDQTSVHALWAASWDYSQAAGNLAIPAIYDAVHKAGPQFLADRWYLPATMRDLELLERAQVPVFGIESRHQMRDFDIAGTSISYPVLFMNFCKFLTMSGIPLRWRDRAGDPGAYPMILVGGQAWCAPEFMAPVVDCVWLGEAEEEPGNDGMTAVMLAVEAAKETGLWRDDRLECYRALAAEFPFLYFPRFTEVSYRYEDRGLPELTKMVSGFRSVYRELPDVHRARRVGNLDNADLLTSAPLLFGDPGMGADDVEVARGCDAWCSFCRIGWTNNPPREESVERSIERAGKWRRAMGSSGVSLVAPDPPMHRRKRELIAGLLEQVTGNVDASSMRIDDYAEGDFSALLQVSGTDSVTLGLEGNSQLTRDLAGKGTSDADVVAVVRQAIAAGIRKVKLYFITNWPGETRTDVMKIVELGEKLADVRASFGKFGEGVQLIFSWTPLLIEAQTPLQWFAVTPPDYVLKEAFDALRAIGIWVKIGSKASPPKLAFFQACQRASRDAGEAVADVIENYGVASWGGFPQDMREKLDEAMTAHGFRNGLADIFGERFEHDLFGWEMIDTGVSRRRLWQAYSDMVDFLVGTDPETYDEQLPDGYHGNEWVPRCDQQCGGKSCGVCSREDLKLRQARVKAVDRDLVLRPVVPLDQSTVAQKVWVQVDRPEEHRFVTNEFLVYAFRRAAYMAQEDMRGRSRTIPDIAVQSVRLASGSTGYRERSAGRDYVEFAFTRPVSQQDTGLYLACLAERLSPWLQWTGKYMRLPAAAKLPPRPASLWELEVADDPAVLARRLGWWDAQETVPVLIKADSFYAGATAEKSDAKKHVSDFWVRTDGTRTVLVMMLQGRLGPYQAYAALAGKPSAIEAARFTARRREFFIGTLGTCQDCGGPVPSSLFDVPWDERRCPRCLDAAEGKIIAGPSACA